jgi:hypothetical protein
VEKSSKGSESPSRTVKAKEEEEYDIRSKIKNIFCLDC